MEENMMLEYVGLVGHLQAPGDTWHCLETVLVVTKGG